MNKRDANPLADKVADKVERKEDVVSGARNFHGLQTPKGSTATIQQTKIDATDRRQIEAQNENKSRTTKETFDDIKRIHQKEKKKQEENNMNMYHPGTTSEGGVIKIFICQKYALNFFFSKQSI